MSKKKKTKSSISMLDVMKSVRSPFATCKMTGAGAHKSKKDFNRQAQKQQDSHSEESAKAGLIEEYLNKPLKDNWYELSINDRRSYIQGGDFGEEPEGTIMRTKTCVMEIWCELFNGDPKQLTPMMAREINDILNGLHEWEKAKGSLRFGKSYGKQRAFIRKM